MDRALQGNYLSSVVAGETVSAFVPNPLPPEPALALGHPLRDRLDHAHLAVGRLDGVSAILPDTHLFLYMYVRKEAVLSSQIEGTQSTLSDLLLFELEEAPGVPFDDVVEVSDYVAALEHGLTRLRQGLPLSNHLIREIHGILLSRGRGQGKSPGEFRRSQNWIGGSRPGNARFVPPPPQAIEECMGRLERFLHDDPERTPTLLKAGLAHAQFETIHPFLDGNGRVGRLLIPLLLCVEGVLRLPLLYLSLFFKQHREEYYERLDRVRREGDWEGWIEFFVTGVEETGNAAVTTAHRLVAMAREDRARIQTFGRVAGSALQVHRALLSRPLTTVARLAAETRLSIPAVTNAIAALTEQKLLREITGRKRNRVFAYDRYMDVLNQGTEPV
jgi:Fic family protein